MPQEAPKPKRKAPLPADWRPKADHAAIARENGKNLELEVERMRDWDAAGGPGSKDWDASFRNWLRRPPLGGAGPRGSPPPHGSNSRGNLTGLDALMAQVAEEKSR